MLQEKEQQARSRKEEVRREGSLGGKKVKREGGRGEKKLRTEPCQVIFLFRKGTRREKGRREMTRMIKMTG